jgi:hypothetical protein
MAVSARDGVSRELNVLARQVMTAWPQRAKKGVSENHNIRADHVIPHTLHLQHGMASQSGHAFSLWVLS